MPASLYGYCRQGTFDPVRVGRGVVYPTSRQTTDYLFCTDCEDVFNKGGESWMCPLFATMERVFPFYQLLTQTAPDYAEGDFSVYCAAQNPAIKVDKILHFAMGLFWKASVDSWRPNVIEPQIELGPYGEATRKYLLGGPFPAHMYLTVIVSPPGREQIVMTQPYQTSRMQRHTFCMHLPGVLFLLDVGKLVNPDEQALSISWSSARPIVVSNEITSKMERNFYTQFVKCRKTAAYLRQRAKHRRRGPQD